MFLASTAGLSTEVRLKLLPGGGCCCGWLFPSEAEVLGFRGWRRKSSSPISTATASERVRLMIVITLS